MGSPSLPALAALALLLMHGGPRSVAAQAAVPVLNAPGFVQLVPLWPSSKFHSRADGPFSSASFFQATGVGASGQDLAGSVWDSRNNRRVSQHPPGSMPPRAHILPACAVSPASVLYVLDQGHIRVINFQSQTVATIDPGSSGVGGCPFENCYCSMCGDTLSPQTLYLTASNNDHAGTITACTLTLTYGISGCTTYAAGNGPTSSAVNKAGTLLYYSANEGDYNNPTFNGIQMLNLSSPSPTPVQVAGTQVGSGYGSGCADDGPALGAGAICFNTPMAVALDASERYMYVVDKNENLVRVVDLVAGRTTTVARNGGGSPGSSCSASFVSHYAPAPALQSTFVTLGSLAWNRDKTQLFLTDTGVSSESGGTCAVPVRIFTFNGPKNLIVSDLGINSLTQRVRIAACLCHPLSRPDPTGPPTELRRLHVLHSR